MNACQQLKILQIYIFHLSILTVAFSHLDKYREKFSTITRSGASHRCTEHGKEKRESCQEKGKYLVNICIILFRIKNYLRDPFSQ